MQKDMCIRFFMRDGKDGPESYLNSKSLGGEHYWIRDLSALEGFNLPVNVTEQLKGFWYGQKDILFIQDRDALRPFGCEKIVAERVTGRRSLFVFGAGHVGRGVALIGALLGLQVTLIDDRLEFLQKDDLSNYGIELLAVNFDDILNLLALNKQSAVVIVTRGHQSDEIILRQIASYEAGYVGMIGSRRRVEGVFRRLRQQGIEESFLRLVKAPIGLEIGARTPQEIAITVHAEIIEHFNVHI